MKFNLNVVFHEIAESEKHINSRYTVGLMFFESLLTTLRRFLINQHRIQQIRLYFDDNHASCRHFAMAAVARTPFIGVAAVPVDSIGRSGYCSIEELRLLRQGGFEVLPHGFSHTALAIYENGILLTTANGGLYRKMPMGKEIALTEQEVLFQLTESKRSLKEFAPVEFVLPYGLYNDKTIAINAVSDIYQRLATCDPFLDSGENLRPRILITNDITIDETMRLIRNLLPRPSAQIY